MAPRISSSFVSILVPFIAIQPSATHSRNLNAPDPSLTHFQSLEGTLKGQTKQGIKEVKRYLRAFGYLDHKEDENHVALVDDKFNDTLEAALRSYQRFYCLKVTGDLDAGTMMQMSVPRCGIGCLTKPLLTYAFNSLPKDISPELSKGACWRAFNRWSHVSAFTFEEAPAREPSDIAIGFYSGDHGDYYPFDGPSRVLAHAFGPTDGRFHGDADEKWSINPGSNQFDLEMVALHEVGHLLGLGHREDPSAVMYPLIPRGATKRNLQQDDIDGIHALYPAE
ncbi:metalloendoproteinase 1-like [Rhodamnia argentea]|uniref:Metalloendoproteinase 1-like n=1 Tax=Rhodamnia argentea TaxID=178133 RepID=A0ABM3GXC6_9MYRT|nr:metalloendoproteinase 1-like [Rhodamnia argentea]